MNETTKTKAINLEDLQLSVQDIYNRGGFGNVGTCNTAAATAAKAVTLGTIFSLSTGCVLLIKFTNGIESENSTLAITHTTLAGTTVTENAKPIYLNGAALEANIISSGAILILQYNGTQFDIIGGGGQASDAYTKAQTNALLNQKVDKENGKGLSANDYDSASKNKLDALPTNSELTSLLGGKQAVITNGAEIGFGLATCATAGNVQAKEVSITNFVLKENAFVSVLFTNGFTVANPTLNINSTGAKAIKIFGNVFPYHKVHNNTILNIVYDGTDYNDTSLEYYDESHEQGAVDLGLPSGLLWADKNIGAARPQDAGLYFSWGNPTGHASGDGYSFSTENYNSSSASALTSDIAVGDTYDMARHNMGGQWRLPTKDEFQELYDNCNHEWIGQNGVLGTRFTSRNNGNSIFFPASGDWLNTGIANIGVRGVYWTSSYISSESAYSMLHKNSTVNYTNSGLRHYGFTVRAVM